MTERTSKQTTENLGPDATAAEPPVPVGMEELLLMAGVHEGFAEALVREPQRSAEAGDVVLTGTERAMLHSVNEAALRQLAQRVADGSDEPTRRAFLARASGAVAALAATGVIAEGLNGCGSKKADSPANKSERRESMGSGEVADSMRPRPIQRERVHRVNAPTGVRPNPTPRMYINKLTATGPLTEKQLRRVVVRHLNEIRACWLPKDWRMHRQPQGKLGVALTVDKQGAASGPRVVVDTLKSPKVEKCILAAIPTWKFPASGGKKTVAQVELSFVVNMY